MHNKLYKSSVLYCVCQICGWFFVLCMLILCLWLCFGSFETVCHLLRNEGLMLELAECRIEATKKYWENGSVSKNFGVSLIKQRKFFCFFESCCQLELYSSIAQALGYLDYQLMH